MDITHFIFYFAKMENMKFVKRWRDRFGKYYVWTCLKILLYFLPSKGNNTHSSCICCGSIFTLEQFVFEVVENSLNWYKIVWTGTILIVLVQKQWNQFPAYQVNSCWLDEVDNWVGDHLGNNAVRYFLWSQAVAQRLLIVLPSFTSMVGFVG